MNHNDPRYLEISHLTKRFPGPNGPVAVVKDFDLQVAKGEFVCLVGHSGCGKSTVLSIAAGLAEASEGGALVDGREVTGPGPDLGVVFQSPCLFPWMTAFENVMLGVDQRYPERRAAERRAIATLHLERVGLADALHKKATELSAGMRQRVGIARAFALDPKVLLLDEPFGSLDSLTRYELHEVLLATWRATRKTAFMVTHDVDEALFLSDRVALMTSGPAARLGAVIDVPFTRPRDRAQVIDHPDYYPLRERLIQFLEGEAQPRAAAA
jgi:nitrate ABC transporter ATP-binding subunit